MRSLLVLATGIAVSAVVWLIADTLPAGARAMTAALVGLWTAFSIGQARAVSRIPTEELPSRYQFYFSTILAQWAIAFLTAFIASGSGFPPELLGVALLPFSDFLIWFAFSLIATVAIVVGFKAFGMRESREIQYLIPQALPEKITFVVLCITAGICEELIFRGFLVTALRVALGSLPLAVFVAAAAFGTSHAHQGVSGALRAGLLGLALTVPLVMTGSLYPAIAAHVVVDILGGLWLYKWMLKS